MSVRTRRGCFRCNALRLLHTTTGVDVFVAGYTQTAKANSTWIFLMTNSALQNAGFGNYFFSLARNPMRLSRRICVLLALLSQAVAVFAQENAFSSPAAAIPILFPSMKVSEWSSIEADVNGDGIKDRAMILAIFPEDAPVEARVVVLAGAPGGKYLPLSISSKYCDAQKFFNLDVKGDSLFITEVHKAEGDALITRTLQFRFNKNYADFDLVGKESVWASGKEYGRSSTNYRAGRSIDYERVRGRIRVKEEKRFAVPSMAKLNGFDCDRYFEGMHY